MKQKATFALGCFWEPDDYFSKLKGVISTKVGYIGGKTKYPTYSLVCGGATGHSEAIEIVFDDSVISYQKLLDHFWNLHDPTEQNATQYASVIFYHDLEQKKQAEESMNKWKIKHHLNILTKIIKATEFYEAEEYHQKYLQKRKIF